MQSAPHAIRLEPFKVACANCNLRELCLPVGMSAEQMDRLDAIVATRRSVIRGDALYRAGDPFSSLYAVRTGFFKTCISSEDASSTICWANRAYEAAFSDGECDRRTFITSASILTAISSGVSAPTATPIGA